MQHAAVETLSTARSRPRLLGYAAGSAVLLGVTALCILGFVWLLLRPNTDPGVRVWMLNHTPDQCAIIDPYKGTVEKKFQVADGLREMAFSFDYSKAFIANVVDVSNRLTVVNTTTYLKEDTIELDGVPQGIGVFPDNKRLAVVLGSKTDFMAGGFDVIDLTKQSKANPRRKLTLYRERDLALTHKIAVADDGDRIYCIDAKKPLVTIYSYRSRGRIGEVDLHGAPEEMYYPRQGSYYYVSVLQHYAIYQLSKATDKITGVYCYVLHDPSRSFERGKLRYMAVDSTGDYLYATCTETGGVAVWEVGNPKLAVDWTQYEERFRLLESYATGQPHYLPAKIFFLSGGYNPNVKYLPGGKQLAIDPDDHDLFVVDEDGALYIFEMRAIIAAADGDKPQPVRIVSEIKGEIRDLKVSPPTVRRKAR